MTIGAKVNLLLQQIYHRFSLIEDKASDEQIDKSIRAGVELKGTNLWVLMFAIMIASIGLNVNSTAVVIGAMLISPLMGPIMGIGYGVGIYDASLIRKSFRNLAIATVISLAVSTLYFFLTPLSDAQSELLARTTPTIWDVLIALFGGLAGIIGATRTEKNNVIPGVAIATALMPPLCTAGYGLANGNLSFFGGAFYLFSINCVFIAFSVVIIIWFINPSHKQFVDEQTEVKMKRMLSAVVIATMLPSVYLAVSLVRHEIFEANAKHFVSEEFDFPQTHITETDIDPKQKKIELTLIGDFVSKIKLQEIEGRLARAELDGATLIVHQAKDQNVDVTALKANIVSDLYKDNLVSLEQKKQAIEKLQTELDTMKANRATWLDLSAELSAQYPEVQEVYVSDATDWKKGDKNDKPTNIMVLNIKASSVLSQDSIYKITEWFKVRVKTNSVKVIVE
jgi:uncharacterized hydrophobic protein (TIGR00271 family)